MGRRYKLDSSARKRRDGSVEVICNQAKMEAGHSFDRLLANQLENRGAELQIADLEPGGRRRPQQP
jgi:hypothetical protein